MGWLSAILSIVSGWLGLQKGKQDRLNAPDMVSNAQARRDQEEKERIERQLLADEQKKNLDEERKLGS